MIKQSSERGEDYTMSMRSVRRIGTVKWWGFWDGLSMPFLFVIAKVVEGTWSKDWGHMEGDVLSGSLVGLTVRVSPCTYVRPAGYEMRKCGVYCPVCPNWNIVSMCS